MPHSESLNIAVVVPSGTHWLAEFGTSLISMMGYFMNNQVAGYKLHQFRLINLRGSILPTLRLNGLKAAKAINASHLLYMDSDHTFPPDTLNQLLHWKKDCVSVNCTTKSIPAMTTARRYKADDLQGDPVFSDELGPHDNPLEKVWRVGTGIMLLSARAYNQIPHNAFSMPYMPEADVYQGEDWSLCEAFDALHIPIYIDHRLSREIGHVGTFNYTHNVVGTFVREEIEPELTPQEL